LHRHELVRRLESNSLLGTPEQVAAFDEALQELAGAGGMGAEELADLFSVFDDRCEDEEVMYGLLHLIEDSDLRDMLRAFIAAAPGMAEKARGWVNVFHYRILNSDRARAQYGELLAGSDADTRDLIRRLLTEIATDERPPLSTRAGSVLQVIPGAA
jgi:hypothetical protein